MKKFFLFLLCVVAVSSSTLKAQIQQFELSVFENFSMTELSSFVFSNTLTGQPRIFHIHIAPNNVDVFLEGEISWKEESEGSFEKLASFKTKSFPSRSFFNDEIGTTEILIDDSEMNRNSINRIIQTYGKPVGEYKISMKLFNSLTQTPAAETKEKVVTFLNPAQTLSIQFPLYNSVQDIGNMYIQWNEIPGAQYYLLNAKIKRDNNFTDEDIITAGLPLVDNKNVGLVSGTNLRNFMIREPSFGDEIVLQISAFIPNPGGGVLLNSSLTRFKILDPLKPQANIALQKLFNLFALFPNANMGFLVNEMSKGTIELEGIEGENGEMTAEQLESLLNQFTANHDKLINISFENNED